MSFWLMKTEPDTFSIDDLKKKPKQTEPWNGVRNFQARNMMRDQMRKGDLIFIYHSSCEVPGVAGIAKVASDAYADETAFDPESPYYDPKSTRAKPQWMLVDVKFVRKLKRVISLQELKENAEALPDFVLLRRGNRLSIMPVSEAHWNFVLSLE